MKALSLALLISVLSPKATYSHGVMTIPISRSLRYATNAADGRQFAGECPAGNACKWYSQKTPIPGPVTNCDKRMRTMGTNCGQTNPIDWTCSPGQAVPWCAPGTAPVKSPCGIFSGGWRSNGRDMRDLDDKPQAEWATGSVVDVAWAITANHGGGYAYRLCKADSDLSEKCFQSTHLSFSGTTQRIIDATGAVAATIPAVRTTNGTWPKGSEWARNPFPMEKGIIDAIPGLPQVYGRGPFNYSVVDSLAVPMGLDLGHYVLSWRWDAEQTQQVWSQCGDVTIVSKDAPDTANPLATVHKRAGTLPSGQKHLCTGDSLGLDVGDCDVWVELYDSLGGPNWPPLWDQACKGHDLRTDPCGCNGYWQKYVQCNAQRDYLRITEIYMLGPAISGVIPASIAKLPLVALSLVGTQLRGGLPDEIGTMPELEMLWLDHNHELGGPIPQSFVGLSGQLQAFELHTSNFTGTLPAVDWAAIPDCTLNGLVFDCPLPKGAETCGCTCK